jgi:hypothetical protein
MLWAETRFASAIAVVCLNPQTQVPNDSYLF